MFDQDSIVWLDGELLSLKEAGLSPLTHTFHYGSGAFEGIRAYKIEQGTHIFRLKEHIDRLFYSSEKMFLSIPWSKEMLMQACVDVLHKNNLEEAYLRPIVFHDDTALGVGTHNNKPRVLIAAWAWGQYLNDAARVEVSEYRRISEQSFICDAKISGHYVNSILATNIAKQRGFDEALLLDHHDSIAEGPGENIFFIQASELHTPSLGSILAGITRDAIIQIAKDSNIPVHERAISCDELASFDGAFFTGTAAEVSPIASITNAGTCHEYDVALAQTWKDIFTDVIRGKTDAYSSWRYMA